jgi:hypothetical protein
MLGNMGIVTWAGGLPLLGFGCDNDIAMASLRSSSDSSPAESCVRSIGVAISLVFVFVFAGGRGSVDTLVARKVVFSIFLVLLLMTR